MITGWFRLIEARVLWFHLRDSTNPSISKGPKGEAVSKKEKNRKGEVSDSGEKGTLEPAEWRFWECTQREREREF